MTVPTAPEPIAASPRGSATFAAAARWYVGLVGQIPADAWEGPGLGVWDLRALTGHGSRSLVTVETYLDRPAARVEVADPVAYYQRVAAITNADPEAVAERGRQAGRALGDDPAGAVAALAERVTARVPAAGDPVIETIAGGMRLSDYLPTRTFELVVHGFDVAEAAGLDAAGLDPDALAEAVDLAVGVALSGGHGRALLLALTGRGGRPLGFSVV
jgi:hypothetical protein